MQCVTTDNNAVCYDRQQCSVLWQTTMRCVTTDNNAVCYDRQQCGVLRQTTMQLLLLLLLILLLYILLLLYDIWYYYYMIYYWYYSTQDEMSIIKLNRRHIKCSVLRQTIMQCVTTDNNAVCYNTIQINGTRFWHTIMKCVIMLFKLTKHDKSVLTNNNEVHCNAL